MKLAKFLELDKPNKNGRTYPTAVILAALAKYKQMTNNEDFPIFKELGITHTEDDIVGIATDVRVEDGFLCGNVGFFEDKLGHITSGEIINIRPNAVGSVKDGIVQDDYSVNGFCIVRKPA
jgi:hypothetical protein